MNELTNELQNQSLTIDVVDAEVKKLILDSLAKNTIRGYRSDWQHFLSWCQTNNRNPMPASPETIATYLKEMMKKGYTRNGKQQHYKVSSFERRIAAISQAHQTAGIQPPPTQDYLVRATMKGIRRTLGSAKRKKAPAEIEVIRKMIAVQDDSLQGIRNRALLIIGFCGAFRRSELVAINVEDIEFKRHGLSILIRQSKTDQEGEGQKIGLPYGSNPLTCPVRTLQDWLEAAQIEKGAVFRRIDRHGHVLNRLTAQSVRLLVQQAAEKAGLDPDQFAGHSLRAGFITSAHLAGKNEHSIMKQSRHKSIKVMRSYIREADIFVDNAAFGIGL